ncbi:MAG TPA: ABC transporter permease [Pyrinomonadaceae bacterium]|nr:ABC transporter permease [Pyrinomonadaceae bacterium]
MLRLSNFRGGLRLLRRSPAFAATVIIVLGLGIGVNTLVFTITDAVLLRPLPYPNPNQLVWISQGISPTKTEYALAPDFTVWSSQVQSFSHMAAFSERFRNLTGSGYPERILSAAVSAEFLSLLETPPIAGRDFLASDDQPGGERVAILSHRFCKQRFAEVSHCVGATIKLNDQSVEVIGVLPDKFRFPEPVEVEVLTPLALGPDQASRESSMNVGMQQIKVIARLRPGTSLAQAQAELSVVQQRIVQANPQFQQYQNAKLIPLHEHLTADISRAALVLLAAVSLLWVLGCLNVGSLLFARLISRRGEMAVRISLGASRRRLFRQVLTENAVLTFFGSVLSLFITYWGHRFIISIFPRQVFRISEVELSPGIVAFVITSFALTVLIVSLVAARALPAQNAADLLKSGSSNVIGSLKTRRVLNVLVVCELALAVVLLVEAGLMIRSFWALRYRDLGFRPEQLLTLRVDLTPSRYSSNSQQRAFFENVLERVSALPGVDAVALCSSPPPVPVGGMFRLSVEGGSSSQPGPGGMVRVQAVNTDYFRILGIPLLDGQMFVDQGHDSPSVVIINRTLARQHLDEDQSVGRKIRLGGPQAPWLTIIGIVDDFKNVGLAAEPEPEAYRPYQQSPLLQSMHLLARTSTSDPLSLISPIRREVLAMDREQPLAEIQTLDQRLMTSIAQQRFVMSILVSFAILGLLLAVVGVYGIISYVSQQRTREIGIRLALGAQQKQVIWLMVREGLILSLLGAAIGIAGARAASQFLSSMLYGVTLSDPWTFLIVLSLLLLTTVLSCYLTARRTAQVEPLQVLRHE